MLMLGAVLITCWNVSHAASFGRQWPSGDSMIIIIFNIFPLYGFENMNLLLYPHNEGVCVCVRASSSSSSWVLSKTHRQEVNVLWGMCCRLSLLSLLFSPSVAPFQAFRHCSVVPASIRSTVESLDFPWSLSSHYNTIPTRNLPTQKKHSPSFVAKKLISGAAQLIVYNHTSSSCFGCPITVYLSGLKWK